MERFILYIKPLIALGIIAVIIFILESRKANPPPPDERPTDGTSQSVSEKPMKGDAVDVSMPAVSFAEKKIDEIAEKRIVEKSKKYERYHDISTPDAFLNTDPLLIKDYIGKKVVLVDFWTYSCINCQRTIPYLSSWHEKYADKGLVIVGVHTPEFEFEKDVENVKKAVEKFGVQYPVVLDNDYSTWYAYGNRYWPRKYIIDIDGFVVYDHIGEGGYEETEKKIVELLDERARVLGEKLVMGENSRLVGIETVDFSKIGTPETYLGYARLAYLANLPSRQCFGSRCSYVISGETKLSTFQLSGNWTLFPEYAFLESSGGAITIRFKASKVHLVAGSEQRVLAQIFLDGEIIGADQAGVAVSDGTVAFQDFNLYNILDLKGKYEEHLLEIRFLDKGISAFAFTFG